MKPTGKRQNHFVGPNASTSRKKKTQRERDKLGSTIQTCLGSLETESAKAVYGA